MAPTIIAIPPPLFLNHLVSAFIIFLAVFIIFAFLYTVKYLHYTHYVSCATDEEGMNDLAKYLARHTGGKYIDVDGLWQEFIPAAQAIYLCYLKKTNDSKITKM